MQTTKEETTTTSFLDTMLSVLVKGDYREDKELRIYSTMPFVDANKELKRRAQQKQEKK